MCDSINKFARRFILSLTIALVFTGATILTGCHTSVSAAQQPDGSDPADANMAPVDGGQSDTAPAPPDQTQQGQLQPSTGGAPVYRVAPPQNESQQAAEQYNQQDQTQNAPDGQSNDQSYDPAYDDEVDAGQAALDDEVAPAPPPELPTYDQPEAPGPDYLWTPGYWGYAPAGYYWVPGVWCAAPYYGALWTPGYWFFYNSAFRFHRGYWGPYIGFYGGVNYGFGYNGVGYYGGYWRDRHFHYNTAVNRINVRRVPYVYHRPVIVNNYTRVSYNGGRGGIAVRPTMSQLVAQRQTRTPPMTMQLQNQRNAAQNRQQFFKQNRGRPAIAAAPRPVPADRGIQRPAIRPPSEVLRTIRPNRTGQPQSRPGQPQSQPQNQPQSRRQIRPGQQQPRSNQPQARPNEPPSRPAQSQIRPNQPQVRPEQPQFRPAPQQPAPQRPQVRPEPPQARPNQPRVRPDQPQFRPAPQQPAPQRPQVRPEPQQPQPNQPQARPEPQFRQPQQRPAEPRPQYNPPQPQQRESQPRPQARPEPQFRQPQERPAEPRPQYNPPQPQQRESQPRPQQQQRTDRQPDRQPDRQSRQAPQPDDHH